MERQQDKRNYETSTAGADASMRILGSISFKIIRSDSLIDQPKVLSGDQIQKLRELHEETIIYQ